MASFGDKKRAYQRDWVAQRRQEWLDENGPCKGCGSTEQLEVDHIDPETKVLKPSHLWSLSPSNPKRIEELAKCQVLCHDCHLEKSNSQKSTVGMKNGNCKLTNEQVVIIQTSGLSWNKLRNEIPVSKVQFYRIRRGERWQKLAGVE